MLFHVNPLGFMAKSDESETRAPWVKDLGLLGVIVGDMIGYSGAGVGLGWLAYRKWGAPWWVLLLTSLAGLVLAFYRIYQMTVDKAINKAIKDGNGKNSRS